MHISKCRGQSEKATYFTIPTMYHFGKALDSERIGGCTGFGVGQR